VRAHQEQLATVQDRLCTCSAGGEGPSSEVREVIDLTQDQGREDPAGGSEDLPSLEEVGSRLVEIEGGHSVVAQRCVRSAGSSTRPAPYPALGTVWGKKGCLPGRRSSGVGLRV
jgi:hypothetical protein